MATLFQRRGLRTLRPFEKNMATSFLQCDYQVGGISQALGHVLRHEDQKDTPNKLEALFIKRDFEANASNTDVLQRTESQKFVNPDSRKRTHDHAAEDPTRKRQRENRKEKKEKIKLKKASDDPERLARTVFVGNIPLSASRKELRKIFSEIGQLETIRLRSVPVSDCKKSKKVAVIKKDFHPERNNMNAYVVFKEIDSVEKALTRNGMEYGGKHLRIDSEVQKEKENKNSVFIGNLPFNVQEEQLRERFSDCGEIGNIRIIRDARTGLGKGFGYVSFNDKDSVSFALKMNKCQLMGRELRVFPAVDKDHMKKPFNKKKDREHRLKDVKGKQTVGFRAGRNESKGKNPKVNTRSFKSVANKKTGQKRNNIKNKMKNASSTKMKRHKFERRGK